MLRISKIEKIHDSINISVSEIESVSGSTILVARLRFVVVVFALSIP